MTASSTLLRHGAQSADPTVGLCGQPFVACFYSGQIGMNLVALLGPSEDAHVFDATRSQSQVPRQSRRKI
jgi:hypothetical protein